MVPGLRNVSLLVYSVNSMANEYYISCFPTSGALKKPLGDIPKGAKITYKGMSARNMLKDILTYCVMYPYCVVVSF